MLPVLQQIATHFIRGYGYCQVTSNKSYENYYKHEVCVDWILIRLQMSSENEVFGRLVLEFPEMRHSGMMKSTKTNVLTLRHKVDLITP